MVDRAALEMRNTGNRIGGSNPSLSAIFSAKSLKYNMITKYPKVTLKLAYNLITVFEEQLGSAVVDLPCRLNHLTRNFEGA